MIRWIAVAVIAATGCASSYQTASLVGAGRTTVSGALARSQLNGDGEAEDAGDWSGDLQVRHGVTDTVELGVHYTGTNGAHAVAVDPKFSIVPDKIAVSLPVAVLFSDQDRDMEYGGLVVTPTLFFGAPVTPNKVELVVAPKLMMVFPDSDDAQSDQWFAVSAGARLSADLRKWALLPEVSIINLPGGSILTGGVAVQASY
jgi:hypothetical protein